VHADELHHHVVLNLAGVGREAPKVFFHLKPWRSPKPISDLKHSRRELLQLETLLDMVSTSPKPNIIFPNYPWPYP
jgi:hypothetical protein